ncbi:unnamed protein product [Rhodiola kirilowii]
MDDLQPLLLLLLLSTFVFCLFILNKRSKNARSSKTLPLPPGPKKLPIIGNMHQLAGGGPLLPHQRLMEMAKKYGPLMYLQLGAVPTLIISSPEMAKEALKTHDAIFADRPYFISSSVMSYDSKNIVFAPYGDYWRQLRRICIQELLSPKRVQSFRSIREDEIQNLVRWMRTQAGKQINFTKKIFDLTYSVTARAAFGKIVKRQDEFVDLMTENFRISGGFDLGDMYPSLPILSRLSGYRPKLEKLHKQSDEILQGIIDDHVENPNTDLSHEDLVDVLLRIRKAGDLDVPLTDAHIKAVLLDIFTAGSETSSTTVGWAMSEMLKQPIILKRAQEEVRKVFKEKGKMDETTLEELHFLRAVIKETLRLHPPVALLVPKQNSESCNINGYHIPAKMKVLVNAYAIGRDANYWTNAERFDPQRFLEAKIDFKGNDFGFIPFGAGRRICPGITFAMFNLELPLSQLLCHFDWALPDGKASEELDMAEGPGFTVGRLTDLVLVPTTPHYYDN